MKHTVRRTTYAYNSFRRLSEQHLCTNRRWCCKLKWRRVGEDWEQTIILIDVGAGVACLFQPCSSYACCCWGVSLLLCRWLFELFGLHRGILGRALLWVILSPLHFLFLLWGVAAATVLIQVYWIRHAASMSFQLYVHGNRRVIRDGSPGWPPRLSQTSGRQAL